MRFITGLLIGAVFAITVLVSFTNNTNQTTANVMTNQVTKVNNEDLEWLAKTIYFEARGESLAGMLAVGLVVENRTKNGLSIKQVVTAGKRDSNGVIIRCKFEWYCSYSPNKIDYGSDSWKKSLSVAGAILENRIFDFTDGATHFVNPKLTKEHLKWGFSKVAEIGNHSFFREDQK